MSGKCHYCKKEITRGYNKKQLCELHYLIESQSRNISGAVQQVLIRMRDDPPWKIKDRITLLNELRKHTDDVEIENCLGHAKWFIRLKEMNKK